MAEFRINNISFYSSQQLLDLSNVRKGNNITYYSTSYRPYLEQILAEYEKLVDEGSEYDIDDLRNKVRWPSGNSRSNYTTVQDCRRNVFAEKRCIDSNSKPLELSKELKERISKVAERSFEINDKLSALRENIRDKDIESFNLKVREVPKKFLGFDNLLWESLLFTAIESGGGEFVDSLLQHMRPKDYLAPEPGNRGLSAFQVACLKGNKKAVEVLYAKEPKFLSLSPEKYSTSLYMAVASGNAEVVEFLLERLSKEKVDVPNTQGNTALIEAIFRGNLEVLGCFLKFDASYKKDVLEEAQKGVSKKYGPELADILEEFQIDEGLLSVLIDDPHFCYMPCKDTIQYDFDKICGEIRSKLKESGLDTGVCNWFSAQQKGNKMQKIIDFVNSYSS